MQVDTLILHNVRSAYNVGAILRTAECAGVRTVCLCGYTPDPVDRFGRVRQDVAKVALGAEELVSWEHCADIARLIPKLRKQGVTVVALEQHKQSKDYRTFRVDRPLALVVGEEVHGIEEPLLAACDHIVEIPLMGKKESLNVSVATGIALFGLGGGAS